MLILDAKTFGNMIRKRRLTLGLQQRELALAVGCGERFIVELEGGKPTCQLGKALAVTKALRISLNDGATVGPVPSPPTDEGKGGYDLPDLPLP